MKRCLFLLCFVSTLAYAQTTPIIPANTVLGNISASPAKATPITASGTGQVALTVNPAFTTPALDVPSYMDALNVTDVQASAIVGTVPYANIAGTTVRYAPAATCPISSTDNGNFVTTDYTGSLSTCVIPDINTSGITPNSFQMGFFNANTNATLLQNTSTTTFNGQTSIPFVPGAGAIFFADANNSGSGHYNYNVLLTGEFAGSQPMALWHDYSQSGTNISDWGMGTITGSNGQFCLYALKDQGYLAGFASGGTSVFCATRGATGTSTGVGITNISFGSTVANTTYSFLGLAATFSGNAKAPMLIANGACAGISGQGYLCQPASHQLAFGTDTTVAGLFDGSQNLLLYQMQVSQFVAANSIYPTVTVTCTSGCTFPTDDTGTSLAGVVVTASSATITNTGTNGLYAGESVYLSGTIPTGFTAATPYYVTNINAAPTATSFQLSAASGTSGAAITPTTGSTGNATVVTIISGIYKHAGGSMAGWFILPTSATYGTGAYTMVLTWTNYSSTTNPQGYNCDGSDETDNTALTSTAHTTKTATLSKATPAGSSGVSIRYKCVGTGGP